MYIFHTPVFNFGLAVKWWSTFSPILETNDCRQLPSMGAGRNWPSSISHRLQLPGVKTFGSWALSELDSSARTASKGAGGWIRLFLLWKQRWGPQAWQPYLVAAAGPSHVSVRGCKHETWYAAVRQVQVKPEESPGCLVTEIKASLLVPLVPCQLDFFLLLSSGFIDFFFKLLVLPHCMWDLSS